MSQIDRVASIRTCPSVGVHRWSRFHDCTAACYRAATSTPAPAQNRSWVVLSTTRARKDILLRRRTRVARVQRRSCGHRRGNRSRIGSFEWKPVFSGHSNARIGRPSRLRLSALRYPVRPWMTLMSRCSASMSKNCRPIRALNREGRSVVVPRVASKIFIIRIEPGRA